MKIVGYQILLRITRFVSLVIRLDYWSEIMLKVDPCNDLFTNICSNGND